MDLDLDIELFGQEDNFDDENASPSDILFEVGEVPDSLHTDDPLDQNELLQHVHLHHADSQQNSFKDKFKDLPVYKVNLSELRRRYEHEEGSKSIRSLRHRSRIELDDESIFPSNGGNLFWSSASHFLDFRMIVSTSIGFDAILPGGDQDHNWSLNFAVNGGYREWRTNYGKLGFDPTGRMLYMGRCQQEDAWLAFAPLAFVNGTLTEEDTATGPKTNTRLHAMRVRRWLCFVCKIFDEIGIEDVWCNIDYPDTTTVETMKESCNILNHTPFELNLEQVKTFHTHVQESYIDYFKNAPEEWRRDSFFKKNRPISITARYGQNQPMPVNDRQVGNNWQRERNFSKIRSISFAIATDIRCIKIERWQNIDPVTIQEENRDIFDSAEPETRTRINNLAAHPQLDEFDNPILIYNRAGERIARRVPVVRGNPRPCGLLFNLEDLHEIFDPDAPAAEIDEELDIPQVKYWIYPQAFLKKHGHFQANGLISPFRPILADINSQLRIPEQFIPTDEDTEDLFHNADPLIGISSQAYNEVMHRIRHRAHLHDVQLGRITAAAAGTHAENYKDKASAEKFFDNCRPHLPHEKFALKLDTPGLNRDLRMENVYTLDLLALPVTHRRGRLIYDSVLSPLAKAWTKPSVVSVIRPHITVFREDCFPDIYNWVSYPITSMLDHLWQKVEERHHSEKSISPYTQELICMCERTLNFCQTGSGKVIVKGLMEEAGLALGLLKDGMPMLWPGVAFTPSDQLVIVRHKWPTHHNTNRPLIASKRSMQLNYSDQHAEVYQAKFFIEHALETLPDNMYKSFRDDTIRRSLIIAHLAMECYVREMKKLVVDGVTEEIQLTLQGDDVVEAAKAKTRGKKLKKWAAKAKPFSSEPSTGSLLLIALVPEAEEALDRLPPASPPRMALSQFVSDIYTMCMPGNERQAVTAPLLSQGSAHHVIKMAIRYIHGFLPGDDKNARTKTVFERVLQELEVNSVPWKPTPHGNRGATSKKPTHKAWVNLGLFDADRRPEILLPSAHGVASAAMQAATSAHADDTRATYEILALRWKEAKFILSRIPRPKEWSLSHARDSMGYVKETYEYVQEVYDGAKPLHSLAMLIAFLMGLLIPNVFSDIDGIPAHLHSTSSANEITAAVRRAPWVQNGKRKGCREPGPYITMVSTFIIAIFDPQSPLRRYMASHSQGLGEPWTRKHSAKAITPYNLVRLGLATALSLQIFKAPKFGSSYQLINEAEISKLHGELKTSLTSENSYGPYNALLRLVGPEAANEVAKRGECPYRPLQSDTRRQLSSDDGESGFRPAPKRART